jgi:two-component system, OmpR family, sensor histidine kinase KdpD
VLRGKLVIQRTYQRIIVGIVAMLVSLAVVLLVLLPFRAHLSIAIPALVFVLPSVVGVVIGGFWPGAVGAVAGFVAYDYYFLPPYGTLTVRAAQNWIALVVYVVVVLIVGQVVVQLQRARQEAVRRTEEAGRLYGLSQALIGDHTLSQLLTHIVDTVQSTFESRWTALVLPENVAEAEVPGGSLQVAATAGLPLNEDEVASLTAARGQTRSLGFVSLDEPRRVSVALVVSNRPVGMLVLQDVRLREADRNLLGTFANQAALAVDRGRLREQALRARLLEEVDRWRSALLGAVSHDLRTPLASIKTAVSSLRQSGPALGAEDQGVLLELIELQSDRLARLVTNLLDMTRIESGALEARPATMAFEELVEEAMAALGGLVPAGRVVVVTAPDLPLLHIDHVLISQVLANILENAERLSPPSSTIRVGARVTSRSGREHVEISVHDAGPGIPPGDREQIFEKFSQNGGGGRAGLGLTIAKAFVEAHHGRIWIDPEVSSGTRVIFTVPCESFVASSV